MNRLAVVIGFAVFGSLACAGVPKAAVNDAATNIADTAAAGKAANQLCTDKHTNCDQVSKAFDEISTVAASLKTAAANAK